MTSGRVVVSEENYFFIWSFDSIEKYIFSVTCLIAKHIKKNLLLSVGGAEGSTAIII